MTSPNPFFSLNGDEDINELEYANINASFSDFGIHNTFLAGHSYYLRVKIKKVPDGFYPHPNPKTEITYDHNPNSIDYVLFLSTTDRTEFDKDLDDYQTPQKIAQFSVEMSKTIKGDVVGDDQSEFKILQVAFTPITTYYYLCIRINRYTYDIVQGSTVQDDQNSMSGCARNWLVDAIDQQEGYPKEGDQEKGPSDFWPTPYRVSYSDRIEFSDLCQLTNLNSTEGQFWKRIGIQTRPGTLIVINGEPIRVGRSGIYELDSKVPIKSVMITKPGMVQENTVDPFLLDYAYETQS